MADIISFRDDPHRSAEMLLPWYATGRLAHEEAKRLEIHIGNCAQCRAVFDTEMRLMNAVRSLPLHGDLGWEKLQQRLGPDLGTRQARPRLPFFRQWLHRPVNLYGLVIAQAAMLAVAALLFHPSEPPSDDATYHTLGAPVARGEGNAVVIFRPDTTEQALRETLSAAGTRIVDGPTEAGAYVIDIVPTRRQATLAALRGRRDVVLAQAIDEVPQR